MVRRTYKPGQGAFLLPEYGQMSPEAQSRRGTLSQIKTQEAHDTGRADLKLLGGRHRPFSWETPSS